MSEGRITGKEAEELRDALLAERERLLAEALALDRAAAVDTWRDGGQADEADTGTATLEREGAQSLALNVRRILEQINDALRRMEAGTYGLCESCGRPIEAARLEALPYATLCLADKQRDERIV
jgi:DnaK suppressor protein